jgi:hypothetical protein
MVRAELLLFAFLSTVLTAASSAQSPSYSPAAPAGGDASACELHVWPSPGLESMTEGWIWNETRNHALHPKGGPDEPAVALGAQAQLAELAKLDLPAIFHLGTAKLIVHADPLPPTTTGAPVVRQSGSTAPCYAEFVVRRLVYSRNALAGGALQGFFAFRKFGTGSSVDRSFTSMADAPLKAFPWKRQDQAESAREELRGAFRTDILSFASYAQNPSIRHK